MASYNFWVMSDSLDATAVGVYRDGKVKCPNSSSGWSYFDKKWYPGSGIKVECLDIPIVDKSKLMSTTPKSITRTKAPTTTKRTTIKIITAEPTTTASTTVITTIKTTTTKKVTTTQSTTSTTSITKRTTTAPATTKRTTITERSTTKVTMTEKIATSTSSSDSENTTNRMYSDWTTWSIDCSSVECGEGRDTRSRSCIQPELCSSEETQTEVKKCSRVKCPTDCCNQIRVLITNDVNSKRSGIYSQLPSSTNTRAAYKKTDSTDYVYYASAFSAWIIHNSLKSSGAFLYKSLSKNVPCISESNSQTWKSFKGGRWLSAEVSVECVSLAKVVKIESSEESDWSEWSACSATCDGLQSRHKLNNAVDIGAREQRECGGPCHFMTNWSTWSLCSASCGGGEQLRDRKCLKNSRSFSDCGGSTEETRKCNENSCQNLKCCRYITLTSAEEYLAPRLGTYELEIDLEVNKRVVYKHSSAAGYIFSVASRYWLIGDNYGASSGVAYALGPKSCPVESSKWNRFANGKWYPVGDMTLTCGSEWSDWSFCSKSCGEGIQTRDRYDHKNDKERETQVCNSEACPTECEGNDNNSHCDKWTSKGYCRTKFVKYMQKNCAKSCCTANQVVNLIESNGAKSGVLCDSENIFNDEVTEPPSGYFQELVLDTINCSNWAQIKKIWTSQRPVSRSDLIDESDLTTIAPSIGLKNFWRLPTTPEDEIEGNIRGFEE